MDGGEGDAGGFARSARRGIAGRLDLEVVAVGEIGHHLRRGDRPLQALGQVGDLHLAERLGVGAPDLAAHSPLAVQEPQLIS